MARKKAADSLVEVLEAGVQQIYGVSGDSLNGTTDSIRAKKQIHSIHMDVGVKQNRESHVARGEWAGAYPVISARFLECVLAGAERTKQTNHRKGAIVFTEGQEGNGVYVIREGCVKISVSSESGKSFILGMAGPGTIHGLPCAILGKPFSATAQVIRPAKTSFIHRNDLLRCLHGSDGAALQAIEMISATYFYMLSEIKAISLGESAEQKLARFLLERCPLSKDSSGRTQFVLDTSQEDIAQMIGVTRETVARALSRFRKWRIAEKRASVLTIHDKAALEGLAGIHPERRERTNWRGAITQLSLQRGLPRTPAQPVPDAERRRLASR